MLNRYTCINTAGDTTRSWCRLDRVVESTPWDPGSNDG